MNKNKECFLYLVRGGLWEKEVRLSSYGEIVFSSLLPMAERHGVVGLVTAGLEYMRDLKPPKTDMLQYIGRTLQLEQRNLAMNRFIGEIVDRLQQEGIHSVLVKGQGVAQCYERPLWRPSGDVDFLLSKDNYLKAKESLLPLSSGSKPEGRYSQHIGINIDPWYVELHGTLRTGLAAQVDKVVDSVTHDVLCKGNVRTWTNDEIQVSLPSPDYDVFLVFTHFTKHFYKEGFALRQICDWIRLLWTFRDKLNLEKQEKWVRQAGLISEWKVFAAIAVDWLGMPKDAMPFYDTKYKAKGTKLLDFVLDGYSGNKFIDTLKISSIIPMKALRYSPSIFMNLNWLKVKERLFGRNMDG